jgi:hypothetical protein
MTPSKIVGSFWFTEWNSKSFGIVKVKTSDGYRFYIWTAKWDSEPKDANHIHKYGSPLNTIQLTNFIGDTIGKRSDFPKKKDYDTRRHNELFAALSFGIALGLIIAYFI